MKVLHFFDHSVPLHSGYTFRSISILNAQRSIGFQTEQITSRKQGESKSMIETAEGLTFHRTPLATGKSYPFVDQYQVISSMARAAMPLAERFKPDVLHAHSPSLCGWAAWRVGKQLGIPVVFEIRAFWEDAAVDAGKSTEGDLRYRLTRTLETKLAQRVDGVACICQGLEDDLVNRGIEKTKITQIPNSIQTDRFPLLTSVNIALAEKLGVSGCPVIGFIGSFYPYEGLDVLVNAMPEILAAVPNAKLLLVGGGVVEAQIKRMVTELGIADKVIMPGRIPHSEVNDYASLVSVFAFPRKKMRLTDLVTPLKPLEAMAQGKLVLASNVGGHRELISHNETGFLCDSDSAQALGHAIIEVLGKSAVERATIIEQARNYVVRERDWQVTAKRYKNVYANAIAAAQPRVSKSASK
jgi:PEP-CTERM/exosortase A-associated glycosyltransferase